MAAAILHVFFPSIVPDAITAGFLILAFVPWLAPLIKTVEVPGVGKIELREVERKAEEAKGAAVSAAQRIDDIALMLPLLLPEKDIKLLISLGSGGPAKFRGSHEFRGQLRRLRSMGLIENRTDRKVVDIKDGTEIDLGDYMKLTPLGKRWVSRIQEMEEIGEWGGDAGDRGTA